MSTNDLKKQLFRLTAISISLSEERHLPALFSKILQEARNFTNAEAGTLYTKEDQKLKFIVAQNDSTNLHNRLSKLMGQTISLDKKSIAGFVAFTGDTLNIKDVYTLGSQVEYSFNKDFDRKDGYRTKSMLVLPLKISSGEVIGVLQLINAKNAQGAITHFDDKTIDLVQALAAHAAIALHNTQLNESIKEAYLDTIFRLARAAEYRDNETGQHVRRMSYYSAAIAERMGMREEFVDNLLYASPLHDIGKIAIPDSILKKEGTLTEEEFSTMRKHTIYGAQILSNSNAKIIKLAEEIAQNHHEKWDGSGYPAGKKGKEIPICARIVSVADVFDALTSKRCYKEPYTVSRTLEIMKSDRGKYFDPEVFDAFIESLDDILQIKVHYTDSEDDQDKAA